jgi:Flp pilus assembly protein TadG
VAAVELAFILPIVLLPLLLGVWEAGRMIQVQQVLDNAVREGARQASTGQKTNAQVTQVVLQYISDAGFNDTGATATVTNLTSGQDAASATQLDHLRVSISLPYKDVRWTTLNFLAGPNTALTASSDWYSVRDLPLTVSPTIPASPQ